MNNRLLEVVICGLLQGKNSGQYLTPTYFLVAITKSANRLIPLHLLHTSFTFFWKFALIMNISEINPHFNIKYQSFNQSTNVYYLQHSCFFSTDLKEN